MDQLTFQHIDEELADIERGLDELEIDLIQYRVRKLRPTLEMTAIVHQCIEKWFYRWKEKNFKKTRE